MSEEHLHRWVCTETHKPEVRKELSIGRKDNDIERQSTQSTYIRSNLIVLKTFLSCDIITD